MPLGFGRSILSKPIVAAAGGATAYAFTDNGDTDSGNKATYIPYYSTPPLASTSSVSFVQWVRMKDTTDSTLDDGTSRIISLSGDNFQSQASLVMSSNPAAAYMNLIDTSGQNHIVNPTKSGGPGANSTAWQTNAFDGAWHCIMASMNASQATTQCTYFFDGQDCTDIGTGNTNSAYGHNLNTANYVRYRNIEYGDLDYYATGQQECGQDFHIGPTWVYDTYLDFTSSTVRGYFYNAANTDGFVDGGTDGTAGGAPTPDLYIYHDGTDLKSVPAFTSDNLRTIGTGAIVVISNTAGPGSGDTI